MKMNLSKLPLATKKHGDMTGRFLTMGTVIIVIGSVGLAAMFVMTTLDAAFQVPATAQGTDGSEAALLAPTLLDRLRSAWTAKTTPVKDFPADLPDPFHPAAAPPSAAVVPPANGAPSAPVTAPPPAPAKPQHPVG